MAAPPPQFENLVGGSNLRHSQKRGAAHYAICPFLTDAFLNVCGTMIVLMLVLPLEIYHLKLINGLAGRSVSWIYPYRLIYSYLKTG